jgi:hypothetical protein
MAQAAEHLPRKHEALSSNPIKKVLGSHIHTGSLASSVEPGTFWALRTLVKFTNDGFTKHLLTGEAPHSLKEDCSGLSPFGPCGLV